MEAIKNMNRAAKDIFGFLGDILITRSEAVRKINQIITKYKILEDDKKALLEIIYCIEAEKNSWHHVWGGDAEEVALLSLSPQSSIIIDYDKDKLRSVYKRYRFSPSLSDREERQMMDEARKYVIKKKIGEVCSEGE